MNDTLADKIKEFLPTIGVRKESSIVNVSRDGFNVKITIEGKIYD